MATFTKEFLSGTPANGRMIAINTVATPGTLIHTAHASAKDEIVLYAVNNSVTDRTLSVEYGGVAVGDLITVKASKTNKGLVVVLPGGPLSGGLIVRAFCVGAAANDVLVYGWVNRII